MHQHHLPPCSLPAAQAAVRRTLQRRTEETMPYPDAVNLPFNRAALPDGFIFAASPVRNETADGYWIILHKGAVVLQPGDNGLTPLCGPRPEWLPPGQQTTGFGHWHGLPVRGVALPASCPLPETLRCEPFNAFADAIPPDLLSLAGLANQVLHWQRQSRYCPQCGSHPHPLADNWGKQCSGCARELFPQIHPCAIVLIRRDDQLLLIRKPEWPPGRYGLVAGFLDMGESLEECAAREAQEETGVTIKNMRYVTSQAWPFPSQIMAGFVADYAHGAIRVDGTEIEDARWFSVAALPSMPARRSIARWLIDTYGI